MEVLVLRRFAVPFIRFLVPFALAVILVMASGAAGEDLPRSTGDCWREPLLPGSLNALRLRCAPIAETGSVANRDPPVRLFRMTTGYLVSPVGIDDADSSSNAPLSDQMSTPSEGDSLSRMQVVAGNDNPYLDFRRPGDPGGVGYLRLHSQVQFVDTGRTGCTLGLRAATPAGLEYDGLQDGPTVVAPNLGWYYDLGEGAGLHGFVGKSVRAGGGWTDNLGRNVEYGVAVHRPVPLLDSGDSHSLFMFVQALGRNRPDFSFDSRKSAQWEVLPGIHWRMSDTWWLSGGVIVPVGTSRSDLGLWQITCSWQF
jgi:hypothetical protein